MIADIDILMGDHLAIEDALDVVTDNAARLSHADYVAVTAGLYRIGDAILADVAAIRETGQ